MVAGERQAAYADSRLVIQRRNLGQEATVNRLALTKDGSILVSEGSADVTAVVWASGWRRQLGSLNGYIFISSPGSSSDARTALTASKAGYLYLLNDGRLSGGGSTINVVYPEGGQPARIEAGGAVRLP